MGWFNNIPDNLIYMFGDDYPMSDSMTYFEGYMFVTTQKYIDEHRLLNGRLDGRIYVTDGNMKVVPYVRGITPGTGSVRIKDAVLDVRKDLVRYFNAIGKAKGLKSPSSERFSCLLVDLKDASGKYLRANYENAMHVLCNAFLAWCLENHRVGAAVEHLEQGTRLPHTHFLYERGKDKYNEFQQWLLDEMNGQ